MSRRVHLVGIGGAGMSAIARVLHGRGDQVTGSDREPSLYSTALEALGIQVALGHAAANVGAAELVLASSAIPDANLELEAARTQGIPVMRRNAFLSELTSGYETIAVAGTHGKTTTTALISWLMVRLNLDPTYIVGGLVQGLETNAASGKGKYFVIEADEYDHAFLGLSPTVAVITNVEHDHPDCYPTEADFYQAFQDFSHKVTDALIVCQDDPAAAGLSTSAERRSTYGLDAKAMWCADEIRTNAAGGSDFLVVHEGETLGLARTRLAGDHNVANTLAAIAVLAEIGVGFREIREALTDFQGVGRRFELLGTQGGVTVIDDYAHHPTEIRATLQAARRRFPEAVLWAVFQPHTFSRLRILQDEFARCFSGADHVLVTDVFAAREEYDAAFAGEQLAEMIEHPEVRFVDDAERAASILLEEVVPGSVVITLSAGDANQIGFVLLEKIVEKEGEIDHG